MWFQEQVDWSHSRRCLDHVSVGGWAKAEMSQVLDCLVGRGYLLLVVLIIAGFTKKKKRKNCTASEKYCSL